MNFMLKNLISLSFFVLLLFSSISEGIRDIFKINEEVYVQHPLLAVNIQDLLFLGAILQEKVSVGFVGDPLGNVHIVSLGQSIGLTKAKVIKILGDKIFVADGKNFAIIK